MNTENDAVRDKRDKVISIPLLFNHSEVAESIAKDLIKNHHTGLATARIKYICRNKAAMRAGRPVSGNVYKMTGKFLFLVDCDLIVEIALEIWNNLDLRQRTALMDHLLTRIETKEDEESGEVSWRIVPPDVQEFAEVAERHGSWHQGLEEMNRCLNKTDHR